MHLQNYILLLTSVAVPFCLSICKDPYLAQDILQEVYILSIKNLDTEDRDIYFVSWLPIIRICFDTWRKEERQEQELDYISSGQTSDFFRIFLEDIMTNPEKHILKRCKNTADAGDPVTALHNIRRRSSCAITTI